MKLKVKRFNTRRPDPVAEPVVTAAPRVATQASARPVPAAIAQTSTAPRQRIAAGAGQAPAQVQAEQLFEVAEDGFGSEPFPTARAPAPATPEDVAANSDIDAIRREGLTGRQLRMARRMAQKYGLPATSDFDAVRLLRAAGIDPFQRGAMIEVLAEDEEEGAAPRNTALVPAQQRLPETIKPMKLPAPDQRAEMNHAAEIRKMQEDLARRRKRRSFLLMLRLLFFVGLPGLLAGIYYYTIATPLYASKTEFIIQTAMPPTATGTSMGGLQSNPMLNMQDSIAIQGYLQSRDAMLRLDRDLGFRKVFSAESIDPLQRLEPDATDEATYSLYQKMIRISYDPTEGIIRLEVITPDADLSVRMSQQLIGYAEEQVDKLTQRLREEGMKGARENYQDAERALLEARQRAVDLQERFKVLSSDVEVSLITSQISTLEGQLTQDRLSIAQIESNKNPNQARLDPLKRRIATLENEISLLRAKLVENDSEGQSLARMKSEMTIADADAETRQVMLSKALETMELARIEANRQARYVSISVSPVAPDVATYPRAFENTLVALIIFAGIYLLISMTAAILREQVSA
ncbi:capsule biosynthesis protein [Paragemmobacter straminiformis]|uniref:Capsule biosynthesis protein n=1 Tax=Paragemmobacter straminiformis TaxID=2045119 RepID=A0A842I7T7_9RHOB|nr:capsule biosynthesis protein [Gemmobacter straminiformis]MBC2835463.1 capsule biosynthesis protein [Gemmobacter straminiformis]